MSTAQVKGFPWSSLILLSVAFASFGWFLAGSTVAEVGIPFGLAVPSFIDEEKVKALFPRFVMLMAVGLILLFSTAFMHPISSFNRFITHWFKSDTVAFLSVFSLAAIVTIVLFWLHIFLYVLTILATEALARIDIQTCGYKERQAFLILAVVSFIGLVVGWSSHIALVQNWQI